jgi:hypothetical protein
MLETVAPAQPGLAPLRTVVMGDPAAQRRLAGCTQAEDFAACLSALAQAWDLRPAADELDAALRPDPLGMAQYMPRPADGTRWPAGPWLPAQVGALGGEAFVDWLYFGDKALTEPFFFETVRHMQRLPFNRVFRYRIAVRDFLAHAEAHPPPDGLIFHMSRCGSTLAAQMLAALPAISVVSEPPPLDQILQICRADEDLAVDALQAMVAAFGRRRGPKTRYVLKLDAWHVLMLPLFRRAFPGVPWVFLYREPVEVLVSQVRQRGMQMVPEFVAPSLFGLETDLPDEDYCARVLAAMCRAATEHYALGVGMLIDYTQLPNAVEQIVLPHFGIAAREEERAAMHHAARRDAKQPQQNFTSDSAEKQREAGASLRALAQRHLADVYESLEKLRRAQH